MKYMDTPDNPFNENLPSDTPETKPQDEIIRLAISEALKKLRVHLPAKITKVIGNQKVNVQPLLKTRYVDNSVTDLPEIQNVMVQMPVGEDYSIKLPISVGDKGSLIFCDRSLDTWAASDGEPVDPQDTRIHDISDPVFIPGLVPFSKQTNDKTTDMVLTNGGAQIRLQKAGTFKVQNLKAEQELITILLSLLDTLINQTFTNTMLGPQPFIASTNTLLTKIQKNLEKLKGS